jgi:glycerate kinase
VLGRGVADVPGAGAAGGTAAALLWYVRHARLRPGIDIVLDAVGFEKHLRTADLVITGEGSLDAQTLGGKVIAGVARRARAAGVPVAALVGRVAPDVDPSFLAEAVGVDAVLPLAPGPATVAESMQNAERWIADAAERAARWVRLGGVLSSR